MGTKQEGTCQCCGRKKMTVVRLHGDLVCTSCGDLYGVMVNRPEAVKKALAKLMPEVLTTANGLAGNNARPSEEVLRALELENDATIFQAWSAAIQIAAELEDVQRKMASMFSEDQLREICQLEIGMPPLEYVEGVLMPEREKLRSVLAQIKATLNVDESGQVVEAVAQLTQAFDLYKQRAELLAAENSALANRISELEHRSNELVDWGELPEESRGSLASPFMDPVREQLADFALKVLNGQVGIVHRDA